MLPEMFKDTRETDAVLGPVVAAGLEALKVSIFYIWFKKVFLTSDLYYFKLNFLPKQTFSKCFYKLKYGNTDFELHKFIFLYS